jgi:AsmA protein
MSWAKRIAIALVALFLIVATAAAVFVATFDANRYKSVAIDWMKAERQRTLAIDGPIELSIFPRLAVKLSKLRLSERGRAEEFAAVDEASLALEVLPLLRKQVIVDRVSARGVRALLTRDAKGVRNIDDLLAKPAASAPAAASAPSSTPAMRFDVGSVVLEDARLTLRDQQANLEGTVSVASFKSGRLTPGVETPVTIKAAIDLQQPQALKLGVEGQTALTFDLDRASAALKDAHLKINGETLATKNLNATLDAKRLLYGASDQKLELDALKLALAGRQGAVPFELSLDWPRLAVAGDKLDGSAFNGRFKLEGANALTGTFESGAPSGGFDSVRLPGFGLKVEGSMGARKIDAAAKTNLTLRPANSAAAMDKLELRATVADPGLAPLQLALGGNASADTRGAQWALQGSLNTNRFDSSGKAEFGKAVPTLQATARFDRLDLNQLLASNQPAAANAPAAPADTPVDLSGLNAINGRFNLSAGQFVFRQYKVSDSKLDASLDGGVLRIARLTGGAWGGAIDASGSADAKSKRVTVKLNANGVNVNALLKDVAGKDLLDGTGRVSADVNTAGASLGALRSNLAGTAALQLRDGAIKGVNLARSIRQAKAALSMKQDALTKAQASEKTDFSELTATAQIAGGAARSNDLDVKSPFLRIGGAGTFDIGRGRIDYTARATVTGAATGQDGAELAALRGVTVPVLLSGPFEAIDWKIQWSGVAAAAVENKLKEKLAEKLGIPSSAGGASAPKEQLKEKLLKGLFGK